MRVSRDEMMMEMAEVVSQRSTCDRLHVGAVIARDGRVVSSGYNGVPSGMPHCEHAGSPEPCRQAVHAEANAIIFAARYGVSTNGAELFTTHMPCLGCSQLIINAGIRRLVFWRSYRDESGLELLNAAGLRTMRLTPIK